MYCFAAILIASIASCLATSPRWDYTGLGPDVWRDHFPACGRSSQSPINIKTACTLQRSYEPFRFSPAYDDVYNMTLTHSGTTVHGDLVEAGDPSLTLSGGGLNGVFAFRAFHLHWGANYRTGSEHQVNGEKYAGEIHFVHVNQQTKKIAVLGMFVQSSQNMDVNRQSPNALDVAAVAEWKRYFSAVQQLRQANETKMLSLKLSTLLSRSSNDFWRYEGSLTTPPCDEIVTWTVFKTPLVIIETHINSLRSSVFPLNHREPQPLYNRAVYRNFLDEALSSVPDHNQCANDATRHCSQLTELMLLLVLSYTFTG